MQPMLACEIDTCRYVVLLWVSSKLLKAVNAASDGRALVEAPGFDENTQQSRSRSKPMAIEFVVKFC